MQPTNGETEAPRGNEDLDSVKMDFEDETLANFNNEADFSGSDFSNGSPTNASGNETVEDSGIGADVDDMVHYQSGQADFETENYGEINFNSTDEEVNDSEYGFHIE